ncbi:MAG: molybdopterin-binding protein [Planctomycetota bacterium]|jgi:molybdenum cofactor synthesis domain-containing protein
MPQTFEVVSVNVSKEKGTPKCPTDAVTLDERGVVGDAHAGAWDRQVSILSLEMIEEFSNRKKLPIGPGEFAENLTIRGLDLSCVAPLDRFRLGEVELEVTQIGKVCHGTECSIYRKVGDCLMPKEGLFCRVLRGGQIRAGDTGEHHRRGLRFYVITLSDRAFAGEYDDKSGPEICELLRGHFKPKRWCIEIESAILPDEADALRKEIRSALRKNADVIITTGGTGVGPRDIAPETVASLCEKTIPGIMENIRVKFGAEAPGALLSRGVAGVIGTTQIYTLPGSVRAVREYMGEILKTLEHAIYMIHQVDRH